MKIKAVSRIMLTMLLISMFGLALSITPVVAIEWWVPYYPSPDEVSVYIGEWAGTNRYFVWVDIEVPYSEIMVGWYLLERVDNELRAGCHIWRKGLPTPEPTTISHFFDVGYLKPGSYILTFKVHGSLLKNISFTVIGPEVNVVGPGYSPDLVPGAVFDVFITIDDVWLLRSYEYVLLFNPVVLEVVEWESYPPFTYDLAPPPGSGPNNTAGYIHMAYFSDHEDLTTYDPVPISRISFHVKDLGVSRLDFKLLGLLEPGKVPQYVKLLSLHGPPFASEVQHSFFSNAIHAELIETIETWNLPIGTENSLTSKLEEALNLLDKGNEVGATHKIMDFINQVEALRSKGKLEDWQADHLITEAQRII